MSYCIPPKPSKSAKKGSKRLSNPNTDKEKFKKNKPQNIAVIELDSSL